MDTALDQISYGDIPTGKRFNAIVINTLMSINTRLDKLEQGVVTVNGRLDKLEQGLAAVNDRLDELEQGVVTVNGRLDELDERLNGRINKLDQKIDNLQRDAGDMFASLVNQIDNRFATVNRDYYTLEERVTHLQNQNS